jgi:hypothetical protein
MLSTEHGVRVPREGVEIFDCLAKLAVGSQSILKYGFQNMGSGLALCIPKLCFK